ncbi:MAG: 16S rRNA (guanine(966)-N(2))-methyltransferase RsmD [Acholeplasmatales bacterium]|nr:16S rRNA (guanine(966)-N(2))-methyltransferase RsmD [Acholeplasmatales bacterium]
MRITAGVYRHREIKMTNLDTTRETQDKVRMAIFNMLGQYFEDGMALDLFSGSGAMGIEAISRGIAHADFNDLNKQAINVTKSNLDNLKITDYSLYNLDYQEFYKRCDKKYDLIFLDPPYMMNNIEEILKLTMPHLTPKGKIIFEMGKESKYEVLSDELEILKDKTYGIKRVVVYRRKND